MQAVAAMGAIIMPHNFYLHSGLVTKVNIIHRFYNVNLHLAHKEQADEYEGGDYV